MIIITIFNKDGRRKEEVEPESRITSDHLHHEKLSWAISKLNHVYKSEQWPPRKTMADRTITQLFEEATK
jgi:hypothetical protein